MQKLMLYVSDKCVKKCFNNGLKVTITLGIKVRNVLRQINGLFGHLEVFRGPKKKREKMI